MPVNNSMSDDYFSFMSRKGDAKREEQLPRAATTTSVLLSDTIDFAEDTQIEVTESFVSDAMMQHIFKRSGTG